MPIVLAVLLIAAVLLGLFPNLENHLERNVLLVGRVSLLMDRSFAGNTELKVMLGTSSEESQEETASVCTWEKRDIQRCVRALMAAVDDGVQLGELVEPLSTLSGYPDAQNIVASYAGEVWFRAGRVNDAITVWRDWLGPLQKIDKLSELYEAGQEEATTVLIYSLDLETQIESAGRRARITRVLVSLAQKSSKSQDYPTSETYWRWLTVQYPERAGYHANLAVALRKQGKLIGALREFQGAVCLQPDKVAYQVHLMRLLEDLGYLQEARKVALKVLTLEPDNEAAKKIIETSE